MKQFSFKPFVLFSALALSACGPQAFVPSTIVSDQTAGSMNLAPKVDIVLGVSQSGGMNNIQTQVGPAIQQFLSNLQNKGWDYHFVGLSLNEYYLSNPQNADGKVAVSRHHTNYAESQWLQPYPGATYLDASGNPNPAFMLAPTLFSSSIIIPNLSTANNDGRQPGLEIQKRFIHDMSLASVLPTEPNKNFLREDALLAVITITNERDTSSGWHPVWNGQEPNDVIASNYTNAMDNAKSDPSLFKYYAIAAQTTGNCVGSIARTGVAYRDAADATGGAFYNLCSGSNAINDSLNGIAQKLQQVTLNFKKDYLVVATQPDPSTIKVYKNGALVPQDATNGWTYVGYLQDQHTVFYPTNMYPATGFMIKLNGTAILNGSDKSRVEYLNLGAQSSH